MVGGEEGRERDLGNIHGWAENKNEVNMEQSHRLETEMFKQNRYKSTISSFGSKAGCDCID